MNNGYKAGNLEVELLGVSSKATSSIDKVIARLNALNTAINAIDVSKFATLSSSITAMGNAFENFNLKNLSSLSTRLNNFGKKISSMDFSSIQKGFANLTNAITPFIDKINTAENSLRLLNETLTKVSNKKLKGLSDFGVGSKATNPKQKNSLLNYAKLTAVFAIAKRLGRVIGNIAQSGADYTETLNLWETAMGNNLNVATEFVNKMNEAYGISEKTLMNAQAIFKNMLGSLGEISDTMAYSLSEGITQMALDYASLYNVTFEKAFTKFQAALAGQVRPIRSVSGYDITENTIFQLYQSLGGTKTMRQLTRTEKQLLSILAIFKQMNASGAVGDLDKTMESFANQSRVMAESWQQVKTYAGVLLTYTIQESGILTYVNAILIFIGDTLKAVAENMGAIQHFGGDLFESTTESALNASDAIDKVQGKLLDFDKFRVMNSSQENALGLDEKLLKALSGYDTILGNASMKARELAEHFKTVSGLFNQDGVFNPDRWKEIVDTIEAFAQALLIIVTSKLIKGIINLFKNLIFEGQLLSNILLTGVIFAILQAIDAFRDGDYVAGILATTIGVTLVGAMILFKGVLIDGKTYLDLFGKTINATFLQITMGVAMLGGGIVALISNWDKLGSTAKVLIPVLSALAGVITSLALGFTILKGNWIGAISFGAMIAGAGLMVGTSLSAQNYANGGLPDKGTLFRAGKAGAEIVYNTPSGQSGVANVQQIAQSMKAGTLQAVQEWWSTARNDIPQFREVSKTGIYEVAKSEMRRRGEW